MNFLILSVTAGEGHNSTAKALKTELESLDSYCSIVDTFDYVSPELAKIISEGYLLVTEKAKYAYKVGYSLAEKRKPNDKSLSLLKYGMTDELAEFINADTFDAIVFTHPFAGMLLDEMKTKNMIDNRTVGILTDFTFHPYWEEGLNLDYVVTPNELLTAQAMKKGFTKEQVLPLGIPIHPKFSKSVTKEEARARLGLDLTKRTVLLMSGSMGYGHIESTVNTLDAVPHDFQIITVCGNNAEAKARIDAMRTKKRILNFGFTDKVDLLMDASDCIITKPGGLTSSEALAKCLPMIIVNPIPGQEDRNTEFLVNNGAAMAVTATSPLDEVLYQFFVDPRRSEIMREAIKLISKPESTKDICEFSKALCADQDMKDEERENMPEIIG